jgi:hypothetical protein
MAYLLGCKANVLLQAFKYQIYFSCPFKRFRLETQGGSLGFLGTRRTDFKAGASARLNAVLLIADFFA